MGIVGEELRPDKCGIVFDRAGDDVITARLEEGLELSRLILSQIESFYREGFSIVVFQGGKKMGFLQDEHDREYVYGVIRGRAKLH